MATTIARFVRHTPRTALQDYLGAHAPRLSKKFEWPEANDDYVKPLLQAVDDMDRDERELLRVNAERINEMAGEEGQNALMSVVSDRDAMLKRETPHARATWVFLNEPRAFRHAEETSYANHNRRGRLWDGFVGPKEKGISCAPSDMEAFRTRLADVFGKDARMKVETYHREIEGEDGEVGTIQQVVVYKEGLPDSYLELEKDDLVAKVRRPVCEIIISYESGTGGIDVVAQGKEQREGIAKLFSEVLLGQEIDGTRIPLRKYDLSPLLKPMDFPTDPEDGIESVKVVSVGFSPLNGCGGLTVDIPVKHAATIHGQAKDWFQQNDPFSAGFYVRQAKLVVKFHQGPEGGRGKTLPVKITAPNRCDLKSRTEKERLIGEKYLARWGLLKEV